VPEHILTQKKKTDAGLDVRQYQIAQRLVVVPMISGQPVDPDDIYAMDIKGMSIYGESQHPAYSFKDLINHINRQGWAGFLPTFMLGAVFMPKSTTPILRFSVLTNKETGQPNFFGAELSQALMVKALSPEVRGLLDPVGRHQASAEVGPAAEPAGSYAAPVPSPAPPATAANNFDAGFSRDAAPAEQAKARARRRLEKPAEAPADMFGAAEPAPVGNPSEVSMDEVMAAMSQVRPAGLCVRHLRAEHRLRPVPLRGETGRGCQGGAGMTTLQTYLAERACAYGLAKKYGTPEQAQQFDGASRALLFLQQLLIWPLKRCKKQG
jgi:hypothetical protein